MSSWSLPTWPINDIDQLMPGGKPWIVQPDMTRSPKTLEHVNDEFNFLSGLGMPVDALLLGIYCKL